MACVLSGEAGSKTSLGAGRGAASCSAWGSHCLFQIHSYTRGCHSDRSLGHLSVAETKLLRDPEGGRQVRAGVGPLPV